MAHTSSRPCPTCAAAARVTTISMTVTRANVVLHSCRECGERWWEQNGNRISFDHLRGLAGPDEMAKPHHMQLRKGAAAQAA